INVWGYFLEIGTDEDTLPPFLVGNIPARKRFRLMELMQPSESLRTYNFQAAGAKDWFAPFVTKTDRPVRALAENVVALILLPRLSKADEQLYMRSGGAAPILAPQYSYDTTNDNVSDRILNPRNQLPPVVQVAMVAIDEPSARKLEDKFGSDPYLGIDYSRLFRDPNVLDDDLGTLEPNDGDLSKLEAILTARKASYRIFSTNVSIRGSKWSRSQAK
ncbi:MAG: hypothetical protein ABL994_21575, partial [Verrucomicrobiales bacterium]